MEEWASLFQTYWSQINQGYSLGRPTAFIDLRLFDRKEKERFERMEADLKDRKVRVKRSDCQVEVMRIDEENPYVKLGYKVQVDWLLDQRGEAIVQSWIEHRQAILKQQNGWQMIRDTPVREEGRRSLALLREEAPYHSSGDEPEALLKTGFSLKQGGDPQRQDDRRYDRQQAVSYAHRWWNSYNPQFKQFDVDCTNYVSQCLWAGGAPMSYARERSKGWWYRFGDPPSWSYSWSVAHSLHWYLAGSQSGLRGKEVSSARQLEPGDVICYDFDGDGRWDHNTIVVGKDRSGEPLVNAHTTNSRNRYWAYRDSYAWTPEIKYKFFHIIV